MSRELNRKSILIGILQQLSIRNLIVGALPASEISPQQQILAFSGQISTICSCMV